MSRSKRRKAQQRKEQDQRSTMLVRGAVIAVAVVIVAIVVVLQIGQQQSSVVLSEDGRPIWHTMELRDANTGETFTLADFDNQDVVVKITSLF